MTPGTQIFQNLKAHSVLLALAMSIVSVPGSAATTEEQALRDHQYYLLRNYKLIYPEEIFDYCLDEFGPWTPGLGGCLSKNDKLKRRILNDARDQLGIQSLAHSIYDECLDFYPLEGVKPVGECVYTRLYLRRELDDDTEEKRIYQKCNLKWRPHGYDAVDTCARSEVNFYKRWGKFDDE